MSFVSINPLRRILCDVSTNTLPSPSKQISPKQGATKGNNIVLPGCDTIMSSPTVTGWKRSIDGANLCDQNPSSFTTDRVSSPESRVDERDIRRQKQDARQTTPNRISTTKTSSIALETLASKGNADSSDMVSEGIPSTEDSETVAADGASTNAGTSTQDQGTASPVTPALKKQRQQPESLPARSDDEQARLIKIAAARLRDRLGRAARIYDAKEARKKATKCARMETKVATHRDSIEGQDEISTGTTSRRAATSKLLPPPELRPSSSHSSISTLVSEHGRSTVHGNNARPNTNDTDKSETLGSLRRSHHPQTRVDRGEAISPTARDNASIAERAIAATERGMEIDGLLKLMKTTTEYDNLSS